MVSQPQRPRFKTVGGQVCLDFLNTLDGARGGVFEEQIPDYASLLAFVEQVGLLGRREAGALRREAADREREAGRVARRAILLLERLNKELAAAMAHARLCETGACWEWGWDPGERSLERVLWPLAHDAATLLTSPDLQRVRECGSDECSWMFVDTTKNHRRRWCQMEVCGNRAKARRHRERTKKG
jgi:predicted RNA-binding Zn ribbon-like protein